MATNSIIKTYCPLFFLERRRWLHIFLLLLCEMCGLRVQNIPMTQRFSSNNYNGDKNVDAQFIIFAIHCSMARQLIFSIWIVYPFVFVLFYLQLLSSPLTIQSSIFAMQSSMWTMWIAGNMNNQRYSQRSITTTKNLLKMKINK